MKTTAIVSLALFAPILSGFPIGVPSLVSQTSPCGRESFDQTHPYRMSYSVLWDDIQNYENTALPTELEDELSEKHVSIGIRLDEHGSLSSCSDIVVREDPNQAAVSVSASVKEKARATLCSSIRTWKFRPFLYCDKPVPVVGVLVFIVLDRKFKLLKIGTTAKERKATQQ
jgi:hypothetical protein